MESKRTKKKEKKNKQINVPLGYDDVIQSVNVVDRYTGEIVEVEHLPSKKGKKPSNGMTKYNLMEYYHRRNTRAWFLLDTQTSKKEYDLAIKLADRSKSFTGSLEPFNDDMGMSAMAKVLKVDRRTLSDSIDKLFRLGVIGKFEVYEANEVYKKYWFFNPYLAFNGDIIKESVQDLFSNTYYAKV